MRGFSRIPLTMMTISCAWSISYQPGAFVEMMNAAGLDPLVKRKRGHDPQRFLETLLSGLEHRLHKSSAGELLFKPDALAHSITCQTLRYGSCPHHLAETAHFRICAIARHHELLRLRFTAQEADLWGAFEIHIPTKALTNYGLRYFRVPPPPYGVVHTFRCADRGPQTRITKPHPQNANTTPPPQTPHGDQA